MPELNKKPKKDEKEHGYVQYIISGKLSDEQFEKFQKEQTVQKSVRRINSYTMEAQPFVAPDENDDIDLQLTAELRRILKLKKKEDIHFTRIAYNIFDLRRI